MEDLSLDDIRSMFIREFVGTAVDDWFAKVNADIIKEMDVIERLGVKADEEMANLVIAQVREMGRYDEVLSKWDAGVSSAFGNIKTQFERMSEFANAWPPNGQERKLMVALMESQKRRFSEVQQGRLARLTAWRGLITAAATSEQQQDEDTRPEDS